MTHETKRTRRRIQRERTEDINGSIHARNASVSAMYSHWRRVLGRTPKRYGATTHVTVSTTNQNRADCMPVPEVPDQATSYIDSATAAEVGTARIATS